MKAIPITSQMFKRVDGEIIQCIIRPKYHDAFIKLGFADSIEQLPKQRQRKQKVNDRQVSIDD
jgi:anti-anti-sigma regulatory factor